MKLAVRRIRLKQIVRLNRAITPNPENGCCITGGVKKWSVNTLLQAAVHSAVGICSNWSATPELIILAAGRRNSTGMYRMQPSACIIHPSIGTLLWMMAVVLELPSCIQPTWSHATLNAKHSTQPRKCMMLAQWPLMNQPSSALLSAQTPEKQLGGKRPVQSAAHGKHSRPAGA